MPGRRRGPGTDLVLSLGILAAAFGALALSSGASAFDTPQAQDTAVAAVVQPVAATRGGGTVHLVDYTDNDGPDSSVILTGAIADYGKAASVDPDGSVNPEHNSQLRLDLTHGSFRLDIAALDRAFVASSQFPTNTSTCSSSVSASGAVPIVSGSGTGSYQGVSGQFDLTIRLDEVDATGSSCQGAALLSQMLITSGSGHVRVH